MTTLHISTFDTLYALEIDEASRGASSIAIDRVGAFDIGADVHDIGFADWGALFARPTASASAGRACSPRSTSPTPG